MKKFRSVLLAVVVAFIVYGCDNGVAPGTNSQNQLRVKGRIASVMLGKRTAGPALQRTTSTTVKNVLVYRDFGDADLSPVDTNGNFSVNVERKACGLVFLGSSNTVIGYLSLASGVNALPLMMVDSSVAQIDMQNITIQNGIGTPQHDPIGTGGEVQMTPDELAAYKLQSSLFSSIIQNLDMNNDGVIDVLTSRPYWLMFGVDFYGGVAPTIDPGPNGPKPSMIVFHFNFSDYNIVPGAPSGELLTPDGRRFPIQGAGMFTFPSTGTQATMYHWVLENTSWSSFASGTYGITYGGGSPISFNMTTPLNTENYIVATHLWYERTGPKITKVHWTWEMLNGVNIDATRLMQQDVMLQFAYGVNTQKNYHITPAQTACVVDVDTSGLTSMLLSCNDLFGNWMPTNYSLR